MPVFHLSCDVRPLLPSSGIGLSALSPALLAQETARVPAIHILIYLGLIILLAMGLAIAATWLRRRLVKEAQSEPDSGFTLSDLRQLREKGELTEEQYQAARATVLASSLGRTGAALPNATGSVPALQAGGLPASQFEARTEAQELPEDEATDAETPESNPAPPAPDRNSPSRED